MSETSSFIFLKIYGNSAIAIAMSVSLFTTIIDFFALSAAILASLIAVNLFVKILESIEEFSQSV